uniref:Uncharacterized protein n=1 Tax=Rhizophora mucronata TaxID=61149 RepID=A0A2P2NGT3_RHIMU
MKLCSSLLVKVKVEGKCGGKLLI